MQLLGFEPPRYWHVPAVIQAGQRLAKREDQQGWRAGAPKAASRRIDWAVGCAAGLAASRV